MYISATRWTIRRNRIIRWRLCQKILSDFGETGTGNETGCLISNMWRVSPVAGLHDGLSPDRSVLWSAKWFWGKWLIIALQKRGLCGNEKAHTHTPRVVDTCCGCPSWFAPCPFSMMDYVAKLSCVITPSLLVHTSMYCTAIANQLDSTLSCRSR